MVVPYHCTYQVLVNWVLYGKLKKIASPLSIETTYYLLVSFLLRNPDPKHFAFENTRHYVGIHIFCQGAQLAIPEAGHSAKAIAEFQEYKNVYRMCVYVTSLQT